MCIHTRPCLSWATHLKQVYIWWNISVELFPVLPVIVITAKGTGLTRYYVLVKHVNEKYINFKFYYACYYLHAQKEILRHLLLVTVLCELLPQSLNLSELILTPSVGVKLPYLPADEFIRRPQPWPAALADLQPPHELPSQ